MAPPRTVLPLEALHLVTHHRAAATVETCSLDAAAGRYLASSPAPSGERPRAAGPANASRALRDGFALGGRPRPGDEIEIAGSVGSAAPWLESGLAPGAGVRVECGARLDDSARYVLPVSSAVLVSENRIRVEGHLPSDAGRLVSEGVKAEIAPAGERLTPRLRALLAGRGLSKVEVVRPPRVAMVSVGDELTDSAVGPGEGEERDLTAIWLADAVAAESLPTAAFGIVGDDPAEIRRAFLRARRRHLDVLIIVGGIGEGLSDRTVEAIQTLDSRIFFERIHLDGCRLFLFARASGIDIFALSGLPLAASASYDLFLQPALLARAGARREQWDWSGGRCTPREAADPESAPPPPAEGPPWQLLAARGPPDLAAFAVAKRPADRVEAWAPQDPFQPWISRAEGWLLSAPVSEGQPGLSFYSPVPRALR